MSEPIFIHGLFRSGSTYFFDKFRADSSFHCYYEPFHHVISELDSSNIDIWAHSGKTSKRMNHPVLHKPHFYEYLNCFENGTIKHFDKRLSYDRFFLRSDDSFEIEKMYIEHLVSRVPDHKTAVLQFNRSSFRLSHFVKSFPNSEHFFLLRNPRSQFLSYVLSGQIFLTINLMITSRLIKKNLDLPIHVEFIEEKNVQKEIAAYTFKSMGFGLSDHYKLFLYQWCWSYFYARESGATVIDLDSVKPEELSRNFNEKIDWFANFSDFRQKKNDAGFLLTDKEASSAERLVFESFQAEVAQNSSVSYDPFKYVNYKVSYKPKLRRAYYKQLFQSLILRVYYRFKFRIYLRFKRQVVKLSRWLIRRLGRAIRKLCSKAEIFSISMKEKLEACLRKIKKRFTGL